MLKRSKAKGGRFERLVANMIVDAGLDPNAHRQLLSGGSSFLKGDIYTKLPIHFELKCHELWSPLAFYNQALRDRPSGRLTPIVIMGKNRTEPFAFLSLADLLSILVYAQKGGWLEDN